MKRPTVYMTNGETRKVYNEWAAECEERNSSVSASSWSGFGVTVSGEALTSNKAECLITFGTAPCEFSYNGASIINTVTLANGETLVAKRDVIEQ